METTTKTPSLEEQLIQLNADVKRLLARDAPVQQEPEEAPYIPETLKITLGAALRGTFRRRIAMETNLEMKEYKGFLESAFVLTSNNRQQAVEIRKVHRWLKSIEAA